MKGGLGDCHTALDPCIKVLADQSGYRKRDITCLKVWATRSNLFDKFKLYRPKYFTKVDSITQKVHSSSPNEYWLVCSWQRVGVPNAWHHVHNLDPKWHGSAVSRSSLRMFILKEINAAREQPRHNYPYKITNQSGPLVTQWLTRDFSRKLDWGGGKLGFPKFEGGSATFNKW